MQRLLITRPLKQAERMQRFVDASGISTWIDPVMTMVVLPVDQTIDFDRYDAFVTTSVAGIDCIAEMTTRRDIPLFCAGLTSAEVACEHGFLAVHYAEMPGGAAVANELKMFAFNRVAYFHGSIIKIDIAVECNGLMYVDSFCVYKTVPVAQWSDETITLFRKNEIKAITFYSERSAFITLDLLRTHDVLSYTGSVSALCLSSAIADVISKHLWKNVYIASTSAELIAILKDEQEP